MSSRTEAAAAGVCLLVFLFFTTAWIRLPGPQTDELLHVPVLVASLRASTLYHVEFAGFTIPVMIMSYIGALKGWLLWLWFRIAPEGVAGYRAFGIAAGLATLVVTWQFVRRYWGQAVGLILLALLATDPSFVHSIRLDYGPVALAHLLKMSALWVFPRSPAAACFLLGLGVWDKANFAWFVAGLGATVALLFPREVWAQRRRWPAAAAFLLGVFPFLAYNFSQSGQTWRERGRFEIRWFKLHQAKGTLNGDFMSALTGEDELDRSPPAHDLPFAGLANLMYRLGGLRQTIQLPLLGLALVLLPLNLAVGPARAVLFPLLAALLTYACMFVTFDGGASVHHVIMVQPFVLLFVAVSLWTPAVRRPGMRIAPLVLAGAALAVNLSVNARHLAIYTRTGGTKAFSDAMYRLAPYLAGRPETAIYALDWGFSNPVAFLSGRIIDEIYYALNDPGSPEHPKEAARLRQLMQDPRNLFLLHSPQRTILPAPAEAFHALRASGVGMRRIAVFEERTGQIVYEVYQAGEPEPVSAGPPPVEVRFAPPVARRGQRYVIEAPELAGQWIDLVYHVGQSAADTAVRFCRLDAQGRATMTVPPDHPLTTVSIVQIRPSGGAWRPARGSIRVTE